MDKKIISFEASGALKEALRLEAFKENISVSELVRRILEDGLNTRNFSKKSTEYDFN